MLSGKKAVLAVALFLPWLSFSAPGSSPFSVGHQKAPATKKQGQVLAKDSKPRLKCNGYASSLACSNVLWLNNCQNSIKIEWMPLKFPGSKAWARSHRNWCTVVWKGVEALEERKFPPEKCDKMTKFLAAALNSFPELNWEDANCELTSRPDAILYSSQDGHQPRAGLIQEARACALHNEKKTREVRCPLLPQASQDWLKGFLEAVDSKLVVTDAS